MFVGMHGGGDENWYDDEDEDDEWEDVDDDEEEDGDDDDGDGNGDGDEAEGQGEMSAAEVDALAAHMTSLLASLGKKGGAGAATAKKR